MKKKIFISLFIFNVFLVKAQQFYKLKDSKILFEFFPNDTLQIIKFKNESIEIRRVDSIVFMVKKIDVNGQIIEKKIYRATNLKESIPNKIRINARTIIRRDIQYEILSIDYNKID